jgi:hypothetical protein
LPEPTFFAKIAALEAELGMLVVSFLVDNADLLKR